VIEAGLGAAVAAAPSTAGRRAEIGELAAGLRAAGFTGAALREAFRGATNIVASGPELAIHERRLAAAGAPLGRLFVLGLPTPTEDVPRSLAELASALDLVDERDGTIAPRVRIVPHDDLLILADLPDRREPDHVASVHPPSVTLAALTVRRTVDTALDVGTGCGVQALLAARHARHVVATDVNERALAFAEFSTALNGVENVELRAGSFFEPVRDERFDLLVANPPYVISPESALVFRDSGLPGDTVSAELVRAIPAHLADDGFATVLVSWIAGDDALERPRSWLAGSACDAWIVHTGTEDALGTAATWNRSAATSEVGYEERVDAWLDYYARLGIEHVGYGAIVLHRRDGENWIRSAELPPDRLQPASEQLERMFAASDVDVLATPLRLVDGAFVDRTGKLVDGTWSFAGATVRLETGIGFGANLDHYGALVVSALDGRAPLGERLDDLTRGLSRPPDEVRAFAEQLARHLVERGFAVPV